MKRIHWPHCQREVLLCMCLFFFGLSATLKLVAEKIEALPGSVLDNFPTLSNSEHRFYCLYKLLCFYCDMKAAWAHLYCSRQNIISSFCPCNSDMRNERDEDLQSWFPPLSSAPVQRYFAFQRGVKSSPFITKSNWDVSWKGKHTETLYVAFVLQIRCDCLRWDEIPLWRKYDNKLDYIRVST